MSDVQIVGTGIDTLKINVKLLDAAGQRLKVQALPETTLTILQAWQEQAKEKKKPVETSMTFHMARMMMFPNSAPSWLFILRNDCLELKIVPRLKMPMIAKVTLTSLYLWDMGNVREAVDEVHGFLLDVFGPHLALQAAQIDLCVDVVGLELPPMWEEVFLSLAKRKRPIGESQTDQAFYKGRNLETLLFSGHGRPVSCKLYNKTIEIKQISKDKDWFYVHWKKQGWNGNDPVWRTEFSIERPGLHEMDLETIDETLENIKRIWAYCTRDWLRMVQPGRTKNRARWATHPTWKKLQHAFDAYGTKEIEGLGPLTRERKREVNIDRAVAAIAGYSTTYAAWCEQELTDHPDAQDIFRSLLEKIVDRWEKTGVCLEEVIRYKKFLYSQKA